MSSETDEYSQRPVKRPCSPGLSAFSFVNPPGAGPWAPPAGPSAGAGAAASRREPGECREAGAQATRAKRADAPGRNRRTLADILEGSEHDRHQIRPASTEGRSRTMRTTRVRVDSGDPATFPKAESTPPRWTAPPRRRSARSSARMTQRRCRTSPGTRAGCAGGSASVRRSSPGASTRRTRRSATGTRGKRCPTGAARALLRVLDKAPETALRALS